MQSTEYRVPSAECRVQSTEWRTGAGSRDYRAGSRERRTASGKIPGELSVPRAFSVVYNAKALGVPFRRAIRCPRIRWPPRRRLTGMAKFRRNVALTRVDKKLPLNVQDTQFFPRISDGVICRYNSNECCLVYLKKYKWAKIVMKASILGHFGHCHPHGVHRKAKMGRERQYA